MAKKALRLTLLLTLCVGIARSQDDSARPPGTPSVTNSGTTTGNSLHPKPAAGPAGETFGNSVQTRPFVLIMPRDHFLGDWWGIVPTLDNIGITPLLTYVTDIAGNVTGGKNQGAAYSDNIGLNLVFDLNKLAGIEGGSFLLSMSQRDGSSLSERHVGNVFAIQQDWGGQTFKIIDVAYQQKLLDDRVELRVGRLAAGDDFLVSKYDYLFMQNAFDGNPVGIFFNSPGMTAYPNATWGALLKCNPTRRTYIMGGVYNGDTAVRDNYRHGVDLTMNGPVFAIGEVGYRCNGLPGDSQYLGDYKAGFWYDNSVYTQYNTLGLGAPAETRPGNWGIYGLFDQVILPFAGTYSNRGLGIFGSVLVSPDQTVSRMPYFFTAGFAFRGISPARPTDIAGFGLVYGDFSSDLRAAQEREEALGQTIPGTQNHETVLEWTYRFNFDRRSLFLQPDLQYILRPGGTGKIPDALVAGCQVGINF